MNPEQFYSELKTYSIVLSSEQKEQFDAYYQLLVEWNKKLNLTAITEKNDVYLKHFFDSITASSLMDKNNKHVSLCDVGSGAGFPSIPLKIVFPEVSISIVDSLNKRLKFLDTVVNELNLDNVHLYHDRAEDFGQKAEFRESFDYVTARAVARLTVLSEYCLPLVKVGGYFIAMKGSSGSEELDEAKNAVSILGGCIQDDTYFSLPYSSDERSLILIKKMKTTPTKYPRQAGVPSKHPLV